MQITNEYVRLFVFLLGAVAIDLLMRWQAFRRVESVAIDISIFCCVYSGLEQLKSPFAISYVWGEKFLGGLVVLFLLVGLHNSLRNDLDEAITKEFTQLQKDVDEPKTKDTVTAQNIIAHYAIDVALSARKEGKRKRRERIVTSLKENGLDPKNRLNDFSFLLPPGQRRWMMFWFSILAVASIIITVYPAGKVEESSNTGPASQSAPASNPSHSP